MRLFLPSTRGWRDKGPGAARRAGAGAAVWAQPSGQDTGPILRYCGRSLNAAFCPLPVRLQTHKLHLLFFSQEEKSAFAVKGAGLADRGLSAPQRPAAAPQHQAPPVPPGHRRSPPPTALKRTSRSGARGAPCVSPGEQGGGGGGPWGSSVSPRTRRCGARLAGRRSCAPPHSPTWRPKPRPSVAGGRSSAASPRPASPGPGGGRGCLGRCRPRVRAGARDTGELARRGGRCRGGGGGGRVSCCGERPGRVERVPPQPALPQLRPGLELCSAVVPGADSEGEGGPSRAFPPPPPGRFAPLRSAGGPVSRPAWSGAFSVRRPSARGGRYLARPGPAPSWGSLRRYSSALLPPYCLIVSKITSRAARRVRLLAWAAAQAGRILGNGFGRRRGASASCADALRRQSPACVWGVRISSGAGSPRRRGGQVSFQNAQPF